VGTGVTLGVLASTFGALLPAGVDAAASADGADSVTLLYPAGPCITLDADYYRDHRLGALMTLYGKSISRSELRKVAAAPASTPPAAYLANDRMRYHDLCFT
jgi:hypothetical protein